MASNQTLDTVDREGIPELNNTNWPEWSYKMKNSLILMDLWDNVVQEPNLSTNDAENYTVDDLEKVRNAAKAQARILMRVPHRFTGILEGCTTAKSIWEKLQSLYKQQSLSRTSHLLKTLHNICMEDKEKSDDFINRVASLASELRDNGYDIGEMAMCTAILNGLPSPYSMIKHVIENYHQELTIENVRNAILRFEATEFHGKAMMASSTRGKPKKSRPFCTYCKCRGHVRTECRKLKKRNSNAGKYLTHGQHEVLEPQPGNKREESPIGFSLTAIGTVKPNVPCQTGFTAHASSPSAKSLSSSDNISMENTWIIDSGASFHMTGDPSLIDPTSRQPAHVPITCANGQQLTSEFKGNSVIRTKTGTLVRLTNVYYIPGFAHNLFSVPAATKAGAQVSFTHATCRVECAQGIIETTASVDNVYALVTTAQRWHERLGHASAPRLKLLGLPHKLDEACEPCIQAKQTAEAFRPSQYNYEPLDLVYTDLVGPIPETPGGQVYYLSLYDQASKASQVFLLPNKSTAAGALMEGLNTFEKIAKPGYKVKAIRSDLGSEFKSSALQEFLADRGITHETTAGYTPQQNAAERLHRTLHDSARAMLIRAGLPENLWGEAVRCASFVRNRTPVSLASDGRTPLEVLTGTVPNLNHFRTFGCDAWVLIPPEKRTSKFSARSVKGVFIGYHNNSTYRVLVNGKIVLSRNVRFVEDKFSGQSFNQDKGQLSKQVIPDLLPEPPQFSQTSATGIHGPPGSNPMLPAATYPQASIQQQRAATENSQVLSEGNGNPAADATSTMLQVYPSHLLSLMKMLRKPLLWFKKLPQHFQNLTTRKLAIQQQSNPCPSIQQFQLIHTTCVHGKVQPCERKQRVSGSSTTASPVTLAPWLVQTPSSGSTPSPRNSPRSLRTARGTWPPFLLVAPP